MSKLSRRTKLAAVSTHEDIRPLAGLERLQPHAGGADIGAHEIMVCVPGPENTQSVRAFGTYTADLEALAAWLTSHAIETIAMESTGVYWIPLFELLEQHGFHCCLINPATTKRVPGRKSDVADCQWLQTLHSYGLLTDSFRPEADLIALRTLLRHRARLIQHRSPHILHMQKALLQMNLQLSQVLSDVTGETGLRIIRAIVAGARDPDALAALRNSRCHKNEAEIALALTGTWREEHLFVLQQSLALFDFYSQQITACDAEIERTYSVIRPDWGAPDAELPELPHKPHSHSKNQPKGGQVREHLYRITGVDLLTLPGLSASGTQTLVAEVGTDLTAFPSAKHFCSWLGLAPHNDISGGKVLRSYRLKNHNRAGQVLIQAAALIRSDSVFGACYRRFKSRLGPSQTLIATAHKAGARGLQDVEG